VLVTEELRKIFWCEKKVHKISTALVTEAQGKLNWWEKEAVLVSKKNVKPVLRGSFCANDGVPMCKQRHMSLIFQTGFLSSVFCHDIHCSENSVPSFLTSPWWQGS